MMNEQAATNAKTPSVKSPLGLRALIWIGSILFGILFGWLLGFLLADAGSFRKVDVESIQEKYIGKDFEKRRESLTREIAAYEQRIAAGAERRQSLSDAVETAKKTLQQMLELQKAKLDAKEVVAVEQQEALAQAQKAFLAYQQEYQNEIEQTRTLQLEKQDRQKGVEEIDEKLRPLREQAQEEIRKAVERRNLQAAFLKLLLLLPPVLLAGWLLARKRKGAMEPLIYTGSLAVLWHVIAVVHEAFPARYHKYIALGIAIAAVLWIVLYLARLAARPSKNYLLKRFRDAYTKRNRECPICGFPILVETATPPDAFSRLSRGRIPGLTPTEREVGERPYSCPSCGTRLFEICPQCENVRHSLLPNCRHCGAEKAREEAEGPEVS